MLSIYKLLARSVLLLMGWEIHINILDQDTYHTYRSEGSSFHHIKDKKVIFVYPHTSNWDGVFFFLYRVAYWDKWGNVVTLAKPQLFNRFTEPIWKFLGVIPSAKLEDRGSGASKGIIDNHLGSMDSFMFVISPKGKRDMGEWRSGFYYLAKQTEASIVVGGMDYHSNKFIMTHPFSIDKQPVKDVTEKCRVLSGHIPQLHYDQEINEGKTVHTSVISPVTLIVVLGVLGRFSVLIHICLIFYLMFFNANRSEKTLIIGYALFSLLH